MVKPGELVAAAVVALCGVPLVYMFGAAVADGQVRAREAPLRAVLGEESFTALQEGRSTELNYLGDDRLAPDFSLNDRFGHPWRLSDHRGQVVVMNFWSITCGPCVQEMPTLIDLSKLLEGRDDVEVVAVSTDAGWDAVSRLFSADSGLTVLFDPDRSVTQGKYGTRLYPETWIVDPEGVIRLRVDGAREWSSPLLMQLIESFAG